MTETWHSTNQRHTEPCGCVWVQQIDQGTRDYHQRWLAVVRCPRHAAVQARMDKREAA